MIKLRVPIGKSETGLFEYHEWEKEWIPLQTISDYLKPELDGVQINRVIWNGRSIPEFPYRDLSPCENNEIFDQFIPRDEDELIIVPGFKEPITVAVFGSAFAATFLGHVVSFAITYAIGMLISTLISYLTAPAKPKGQGQSSATSYGWQGIQNSYGPGDPKPVTFGMHRVGVKVIHYSVEEEYLTGSKHQIDLTKTKMWVNMLGSIGRPIHNLTNIEINNNPITNYGSDILWWWAKGTTPNQVWDKDGNPVADGIIPGFDEDKTSIQYGVELNYTPIWVHNKSYDIGDLVLPTVENEHEYECTVAGTSGGTEPTWPTTDEQTVKDPSPDGPLTWTCRSGKRCVYTTTEGDDRKVTAFQVHFEAPGGIYFAGQNGVGKNQVTTRIEYRVYKATPPYNAWVVLESDIADSNKTSVCRWSKRIDDLASNRYDIRITKLFVKHAKSSSTSNPVHTIQVAKITEIQPSVTHRYDGTSLIGIRALATANVSDSPPTVTGLCYGIEIPVWTGSAWENQWTDNPAYIGRAIALDTTWGFGNWISPAEINDDCVKTFANYCAECNLLRWSEAFDNAVWTKSNITVTPDSVLCPDGIRQVADTLTATGSNATILQAITGSSVQRAGSVYLKRKTGIGTIQITADGTNWTTVIILDTVWTQFTDIRTASNPSFGIKIVTSGDAVYAWGAMLNTGDTALPYLGSQDVAGLPRHSCNFVWDQRRKFMPMLQDVWGQAGGIIFRAGGKFYVVPDRPRSPSQLFTMENIIKNSLKMEWVDERLNYNAYDVSFLSKNQGYKTFAFSADLGETPIKPKNISLFGITDGDEATRNVNRQLNIIRDLHESISFGVGVDAINCLPGGVINFQHKIFLPQYGIISGRASQDSLNLNRIYLDAPVTLAHDKTYQVIVRFSGGDNPDVMETRTIANGEGTYDTYLTVTDNFSQLIKQYDLYAIGEVGIVVKPYALLEIERKPDQTCQLNCLEYKESVYFNPGFLDDTVIQSIHPTDVPPNPILSLDATEEAQRQDDKTYIYNVLLGWSRPLDTIGAGEYLGANLYHAYGEVAAVLGDFGVAEGWVGGVENTTPGQFKTSPSRKVTSTAETWASTIRTLGAPQNFSGSDYDRTGLWVFIDNSQFLFGGDCLKILIKTDDSNYYSYIKSNATLTGGFNYILLSKSDFTTVGSPSWANINKYECWIKSNSAQIIGGKSVGGIVNGSFDCFNFFKPFAWQFKGRIDGTSYRWPNAQQGEVLLFKVNPYSKTLIENPTGCAYAGLSITGYDTSPPVPPGGFALALTANNLAITASWTAFEALDLDGYEVHAKKTPDEFTPDATTLIKKQGRSTTITFTAASVGTWSVKVRAFDQSDPPNYSDYCAKQSIAVHKNDVRNTNAPPTPTIGSPVVNHIKTKARTTASITFNWEEVVDPDGDEVFYEVAYWIKTTQVYGQHTTVKAKSNTFVTVNNLEISHDDDPIVYQYYVFARDNWKNYSDPQVTPAEVDPSHDTSPPDIAVVATFVITPQTNHNKLAWTVGSGFVGIKDFGDWVIYRNTVNSYPGDDNFYDVDNNRSARSYKDLHPADGIEEFYWLKIRDKSNNYSVNYKGPVSDTVDDPGIPGPPIFIPDVIPPKPDPPTGMNTGIPTLQAIGSDKYEVDVSWNVCTDESGEVSYIVWDWKDGTTKYHKSGDIKDNTLTIKNLEAGFIYHWKVLARDANNNRTSFCADQNIVVGNVLDTPTGMSSSTGLDEETSNLYDTYLELNCTRVAGNDYQFRYKKSGGGYDYKTIDDPGTGGTITFRKGKLSKSTTYLWNVRAVKGTLQSAYCEEQTRVTQASVAPSPPTNVKLYVKPGQFEIHWAAVAQAQIKAYWIMINTAPDSETAEVIKQVPHPQDKTLIPIGSKSSSFTIGYNTPYYFWVMTVDKWDNASSRVASDPTNAKLFKTEELKPFSSPWKHSTLIHDSKSIGVNDSQTYPVPVGKVWQVTQYKLVSADPGVAGSSLFFNGIFFDMAYDVQTTHKNVQYCNGLYLGYGDSIKLETTNHVGNSAKVWINQFDEDSDVVVKSCMVLNDSVYYTVTDDKNFMLTFAIGIVERDLELSINGGGAYDTLIPTLLTYPFSIGIMGGILEINGIPTAQTRIRGSGISILVWGLEVKA